MKKYDEPRSANEERLSDNEILKNIFHYQATFNKN